MRKFNEILEWEGITQPSYYNGQILAETGLKAMNQIVATGANTVTIIPNFFQDNKNSNSMGLHIGDPNNPWDNESDSFEQVEQSILAAKARGLKVVLKPHVETRPQRDWRGGFEPTDPKKWFENYKAMMVEYAKAAQAGGAEMFCVGTEMDSMIDPTKVCSDGKTYTQKWVEIIDAVREKFKGKITYAATYMTVKDVGFWDKVDYIGVDAYIPSSTVNDPTVSQIVDAWVKPHFNSWVLDKHGGKSVVDYYKALSEQYGKQVIFTEVGYKSMDGANKDPGIFGGDGVVDFKEQVDCYKALFEVIEDHGGQWLAGAFLWSYYSFENPMAERGVSWADYTTQHKPANATVTEHYSGPAHRTGRVWNGTNGADKLDGGYHNDTLNGAGGNDTLWGGAGQDRINGGDGNDVMTGGFGDDVIDGGAGSEDKAVFSGRSADYSIAKNSDGSITILDRRADGDGRDSLSGVEIFQFSDGTVASSSIPDAPKVPGDGTGVQDLVLIGTKKANKLVGGAGNDKLYGMLGKDVLTGGTGHDIFVFNTKPDTKNVDKITDFNVTDDTIWLENKYFKVGSGSPSKPKAMAKKYFHKGAEAHDANDRVIYDSKKGFLYYDADGTGSSAQVKIAILSKNLKMTYKDFFVI
jgi:serralysin